MKRRTASAFLAALCFLTLNAQVPPKPQAMTVEEVRNALVLVDNPLPVPEDLKAGFDVISEPDTLAMLSFFASDWMEGRETGTRGLQMSADYAISLLKMWGLKPGGDTIPPSFRFRNAQPQPVPAERTYVQDLALREVTDFRSSLDLEIRRGDAVKRYAFQAGVDFDFAPLRCLSLTSPVVFAGYGIREDRIGWDELKNVDVKGKILMVLTQAPGRDDPQSPFQAPELKEKYFPPALPPFPPTGAPRFNKAGELSKLGPAAILVVVNNGKDSDTLRGLSSFAVGPVMDDFVRSKLYARRLELPGAPIFPYDPAIPVIVITREIANAVLEASGQTIDGLKKKIETTRKPASMEVPGARLTLAVSGKTSLVRTSNVVAVLEGSDPVLKNEYVVIGAHYDHLGKTDGAVFNGADDNGSGSIGVLAVAQAMARNPKKPKRSVVFCLWTAEEVGLYGSRYYIMNPPFPLDKTVGYINYDMISRTFDQAAVARLLRPYNVPGAEDLIKKVRPKQFVQVEATAGSGFDDIQRRMNAYVGLDLALRQKPLGQASEGSDQVCFAEVKIPFVYYEAAQTDDYHRPSDTVERISGDLMVRVIRLGYLTTFAFADK